MAGVSRRSREGGRSANNFEVMGNTSLPKPKAPEDAGEEQPITPTSLGDVGVSLAIPEMNYPEVAILMTARNSAADPTLAKGVVIGEKRLREYLTSSPSKKGKADDCSKGKEAAHEPEAKKKVAKPSDVACSRATPSPRLGEGSSANLGTALGPSASILGSPSIAEKLLWGMIPPANKEKVEKLTLDQTTTKLFHVIGQAIDELAKVKVDKDSLADKLERSGVLVVELREKMAKAWASIIDEFKSSSDFLAAVEDVASKYFGMGLDHDRLTEEDEIEEEKEKEGEKEEDGGKHKGNVNPLL
ncbi:hypothetical protein Acr_00g0009460 [Actinidia rufa]|uniref:Uncharacterized protein n=1 Tax=Actinidia rufa TaxID=165716 RepID=A0A7J0D8Z7_9ERIC|nr:hypothetical protein Acr_00g0009460 [Actinidia rufa]